MPVTRSARKAATRANTKRTILSALDENKPASTAQLQDLHQPVKPPTVPLAVVAPSTTNTGAAGVSTSAPSSHSLPDINVLHEESVHALLDDLRREVKARQESLSIKAAELVKNQQEVFFVQTMKLEKSVKKMTVREFNATYMQQQPQMQMQAKEAGGGGGGQEGEENDAEGANGAKGTGETNSIIDVLKALMIPYKPTNRSSSSTVPVTTKGAAAKKRVRGASPTTAYNNSYGYIETPSAVRQQFQTPHHNNAFQKRSFTRTPGTILRTVRKGEVVFSANGSPIEQSNEGDLVATVCKKRRGNGNENGNANGHEGRGSSASTDGDAAVFDINIGDGRYITLSDPSNMEHLTSEMKNNAKNQLNVLQDQLSKLLSHLN